MTADPAINDTLAAWDRDCLLHPTTHTANHARGDVPGRIVTAGEGVYVTDREGNRLLDGFAALYCVNAGYGRREIADAMAEQARKLAYFHAFAGHGNEPAIRLARMIMDRAPDHMARVYFGLSGSDANETNVKLAWHYNILRGKPDKRKIVSRWRAYHGSGLVSGSMTGLAAGTWFPPMSVAPKIAEAMLRRGVIARALPEGDMIGFAPPLCITPAEVDIAVAALRGAVHEVLGS